MRWKVWAARLSLPVMLAAASVILPTVPANATVPYDGKFYEIRAVANNLCLDVGGSQLANKDPVVQRPCNGSASQRWRPEFLTLCDANRGVLQSRPCYVFRNERSKKCLDVQWGNLAPGTPVWQWPCTANNAQVFTPMYIDAKKLHFRMMSGLSNFYQKRFRCLDVPYVSARPEVQEWIYTCNGTIAQTWYLYAFRR